MTMLERLKRLNPTLPLFDVHSPAFADYGRVLAGYDVSGIAACAAQIAYPADGSAYLPSVEAFETLVAAQRVTDAVFGTLPAQMGYCYGKNDTLNAAEWHSSSELNIALTPLVLILGRRTDVRNGRLDSAAMKAFYLPAGTVVEVYATTLHFCPIQVQDAGFGCVVGLPRGTNLPLDGATDDPLLFRKNKWILAHEENAALIARGVVSGIYGENYKVRY